MSPILGIVASQNYTRITGSFNSIATITPSGAGSFSFTSIPSTYKHLQLRYITRNNSAAYYVLAQFNSDTGSNYTTHLLNANGSSIGSGAATSIGSLNFPRNSATNPFFGAGVVDILDYTNTNKYTTIRSIGGYVQNGTGQNFDFNSGVWMNTATVTSITISVLAGTYTANSHFALYGIQG